MGCSCRDLTFTNLLLPVLRVAQDSGIKSTLVEREPMLVRFQPHCTVELGCVSVWYIVRDKTDTCDVVTLYAKLNKLM